VAFVDDEDPVEQLAAQGSDHSFADGVCSRCSRWTGQDADALGGEDRVECPGEPGIPVAEQELHGGDTVAKVHHQVASGLSGPGLGGMGADPDQMGPAGTVLDGDQGVDPGEKHGVHVQEVHGQHRLSLGGEELAPGRTRPARRGTDTGVMQNLSHRGGGDAMTEPNQLALYPPVSQVRLSAAIRMTMLVIAAAVGGRPGRRRAV
jgi:hypothetical protein